MIFQVNEISESCEGEKGALRDEHARTMQELVEDTHSRLQQMELDYRAQIEKNVCSFFLQFVYIN